MGPQHVWCLTAERKQETYPPEKYDRSFCWRVDGSEAEGVYVVEMVEGVEGVEGAERAVFANPLSCLGGSPASAGKPR